jgi:glucose/arabinose dehydrogenase
MIIIPVIIGIFVFYFLTQNETTITMESHYIPVTGYFVGGGFIYLQDSFSSLDGINITEELIEEEEVKINPNYRIEKLFSSENIVTGLDISENNDILILERWGKISLLDLENLDVEFYAQIPNVMDKKLEPLHETGAFDILIDKYYPEENIIYVTYTSGNQSLVFNLAKIQMNKSLDPELTTLFQTSANQTHNGGKLLIDKNQKLYISIGEQMKNVRDPSKTCPRVSGEIWCNTSGYPYSFTEDLTNPNAQNKKIPLGKILRLNTDGTIPEDNPFDKSPVYAFGFRNVFGMTEYDNGILISDNGPDRGDEINILYSGKNYGWPIFYGFGQNVVPKEVYDKLDYENVSWPFATFTPTGGITAVLATHQDEILIGFSNGKLFKFTLDSKCPSTFCVKKIDFIAHLKGITDLVGSTNNTVYIGAFDGIYRIEEKPEI